MTSLDHLDLPTVAIEALKAAGIIGVEELGTKTAAEVSMIDGIGGLQGVTRLRSSLRKLGWDLRSVEDDPPGVDDLPSVRALTSLFDRLDLAPVTRRSFRRFLLGAIIREELCAASDRADADTMVRLVAPMDAAR